MTNKVWEKYFFSVNWDAMGFEPEEIAKYHKGFDGFFKELSPEEQLIASGLLSIPQLLWKLIKKLRKVFVKGIKHIRRYADRSEKQALIKMLENFRINQDKNNADEYGLMYAQYIADLLESTDFESDIDEKLLES
jgi:hypothetical protein